MSKLSSALDRTFKISERGSNVKTEIFAGLTTFLAMCYILTVNPSQIIWEDTNNMWASVFLATVFGAVIGTVLMAFLAKMPYAQAPGMGLNAQVGALIGASMGLAGDSMGFNFGTSMLLVLISGVIFFLLTVLPCGRDATTGKMISLREKIFDGIPAALRAAIPVGIGLFIAFIGMQNAGLIGNNEYTLVSLADFTNWTHYTEVAVNGVAMMAMPAAFNAIVCVFGLILIAILTHVNVKGATILGILGATVLGILLQLGIPKTVNGLPVDGFIVNFDIIAGQSGNVTWAFWENFRNFFSFDASNGGAFLACFHDIDFSTGSVMFAIMTVVSFCMIDMFDTMGTIMGCASKAGLLDEKGKPLAYSKCMYADSVATMAGACLGTSTVTTYVESGTGVAAGGKTGLTALVVAVLFFLSIFLLPLFAFIPTSAAASALIYVGVLMMSQVKNIDFTDIRVAVPAFLTIVVMPFGYSITNGIGIGLLTYVVIALICWLVEICKFSYNRNRAPAAADTAKVYDVRTGENGETIYQEGKGNTGAMPKFPISIVTAVVAVLFLIYFFVPKTI